MQEMQEEEEYIKYAASAGGKESTLAEGNISPFSLCQHSAAVA
jgi:hypothetical protein